MVWQHANPTAALSVCTYPSCSSEENKLLNFLHCMSLYWTFLGCNLETHSDQPTWSIHAENECEVHAVKDESKHMLMAQPEKTDSRQRGTWQYCFKRQGKGHQCGTGVVLHSWQQQLPRLNTRSSASPPDTHHTVHSPMCPDTHHTLHTLCLTPQASIGVAGLPMVLSSRSHHVPCSQDTLIIHTEDIV